MPSAMPLADRIAFRPPALLCGHRLCVMATARFEAGRGSCSSVFIDLWLVVLLFSSLAVVVFKRTASLSGVCFLQSKSLHGCGCWSSALSASCSGASSGLEEVL